MHVEQSSAIYTPLGWAKARESEPVARQPFLTAERREENYRRSASIRRVSKHTSNLYNFARHPPAQSAVGSQKGSAGLTLWEPHFFPGRLPECRVLWPLPSAWLLPLPHPNTLPIKRVIDELQPPASTRRPSAASATNMLSSSSSLLPAIKALR